MRKESWVAGNNVEVTRTLTLGKKVEKYDKLRISKQRRSREVKKLKVSGRCEK